MNELAIFPGAGGGLLATGLIGWRTVCAIEPGPHNAGLLAQRQNDGILPPFPIWSELNKFAGLPWRGAVDVVSGVLQWDSDVDYQKYKGKQHWPHIIRLLDDVQPSYYFTASYYENITHDVMRDLGFMGYKCKALTLSAKDVGADHLRRRYWILAYTNPPNLLLGNVSIERSLSAIAENGIWKDYTNFAGVHDGISSGLDRLASVGCGQVPVVVIAALCLLCRE